ncbi:MAG TPA: tetratricopeptide repeat protein, partial [Flavipsychrobacter sp.]|nr:tetratricopeptide repeat protein [Flavipsychrobacter sp.]
MRYQLRKHTCTIVTGAFLSLLNFQGFSQEHQAQRPEHKWLRLAEEQYHQGHYQLALQSAEKFFSEHYRNIPLVSTDERDRAKYFQTLAQLKLGTNGIEDSATKFLSATSNPVYRQRTAFALAQYHFRREQLNKAIPYYESASIANLTNHEIADSKFELAYAYFNSRQFDKAAPLFASIKEVQGKYYLAGNYYFGLLAYNSGKYEEALNSFKRIDNEPQYKNIVPYYIAELYYFMGNRKKALEEAMRLTKRKEKIYYDNELHLLAAQVLFEEQRYGEALPFFEHYYDNAEKVRKEELYEMGYSYYRVNEWANAIEMFKPLSNAQDSLGQTAMYLLGDCYLKTNDKKSARNAFGICSDMPYNRGQREASLLLFGKLSYEIGYNDDAVRSFTTL